jgi:pimeloyl-ACP methyl ester carboxylesterase
MSSPPRLPLAIDTRRVTSFDGTDLAYHATRAPFDGAPVVVLANGLGGSHLAWRTQIDYLGDRYRFLTWDYRGLYGSRRPPEAGPEAYSIARHARDLGAVLAAEGVRRASFVGWSMGVQVVLEALRDLGDVAANVVLINGTHGRPLETLSPLPGVKVVLPTIVDLVGRMHGLAGEMARRAAGQPEAAAWLKRIGLLGEALDDGVFAELAAGFGDLDMEPFFENLRALGKHDAADVLERIDVPALVVTGDRDLFTPSALAQQMARRIPTAEILVVRGGTHYAAVEHAELVSLRLEKFYRDHGF